MRPERLSELQQYYFNTTGIKCSTENWSATITQVQDRSQELLSTQKSAEAMKTSPSAREHQGEL